VQTISIPSTGTTTQCTLSGATAGEGQLTLSFDGALVSFACYVAPVGIATISSTPATSYTRGVVGISPDGVASTRVSLELRHTTPDQYMVQWRWTLRIIRTHSALVVARVACRTILPVVQGRVGVVTLLTFSRSVYLSVAPSHSAVVVTTVNVRKSIVLPTAISACNMAYTLYTVFPSTAAPGLGIGSFSPLPVAATAGTRITTNTATDPFYGTNGSPASFVFFNSTWLWICDDGLTTARGGVWLFTYFSSSGLFQPSSSSSRIWSAGQCSDITLQTEAG